VSKDNYFVIDLETTVNSLSKDKAKCGVASPHYYDNWIVATGIMTDKCQYPKLFYKDGFVYNKLLNGLYHDDERDIETWLNSIRDSKIIVGHNIAFDINYILNNFDEDKNIKIIKDIIVSEPIIVWDTMLVEHMLSGQQWRYPSLDDVCIHYGLPIKDKTIKELWDVGVKTEDIDKELLLEYLSHDVVVTKQIFELQRKEVDKSGMRNIVFDELRARMSTILMEHNGTPFNETLAEEIQKDISKEIEDLRQVIIDNLKSINYNVNFTPDLIDTINISSPQQVSKMIFGGEIDWFTKEPELDDTGKVVLYKSGIKKGHTKWKKVTNSTKLIRIANPRGAWKTSKIGIYSTSDDVLSDLLLESLIWYSKDLIECIQEFRKLTKERDTYLTGLLKVCWDGGLLHPTFNHVETPTGRLSCRNPNIQNITTKK
jgi:DNA polymerase I-like protein with 3'-5' exonuclease and polymerase domains